MSSIFFVSAQFVFLLGASFQTVSRDASPAVTVSSLERSSAGKGYPVLLCRRLVDDWRVQLLIPGVEHYSIWLPEKELHRGATADGLGYPLHWVDEVFLRGDEQERLPAGLSCEPVLKADAGCVEREVTQRSDEGAYSLSNHCQHKAIEVLEMCGGEIPPLLPKVIPYF